MILEGDPGGIFNLANELSRTPRADVVDTLYRLAIARGVVGAPLNYGWFLTREGRHREALAQFTAAHEAGDPLAPFHLGETYWTMGRHRDAVTWLEQAGSREGVALRLARSYRALGDATKAERVLLEAKDRDAEAAVELVTSSGVLARPAAIALLERHLERGAVDVLIPLAELYSRDGDTATEIRLLRRSVEEGEPNAAHNLGLALWRAGRLREGRMLLKEAAARGDRLSQDRLRRIHGERRAQLRRLKREAKRARGAI